MISEDLKDPINAATQQHRVNIYVNREAVLRSNLDRIYILIWGQCYHGINSIFHKNDYFEYKSDIFDCLWILKQVKEVTTVLDVKSNEQYNLHVAMLNLLTMRQGKQESEDSFNMRFNGNNQKIDLIG